MDDLRELQRTERSGIPVWWGQSPGEVTGALLFRVGRSDEALAIRGITHLVEHLALFPLGRRAYGYNGFVDDSMTVFYATGDLDEVCGFLREVADNLSALPLDRLETERRVLRREADGYDPGLSLRLLGHRFGAGSYGLGVYKELGLRRVSEEEVADWAAQRFVAGNAVMWMTHEPPEDLELALAPGSWRAPVEPAPLELELPAHVHEGSGGVVLSTWGRRSAAATAGIRLAGEQLEERLRREAGLTYSAYGDADSFGGHWRHGMLGADCADRDADRVRQEIWRVASEIAEHGPQAPDLERYARVLGRFFTEPDALRSHLAYVAHDDLHRFELESSADAIAELEAMTPAQVAAATAELLDTAILLAPDALRVPLEGFHAREVPSPPEVSGRTFRSGERREGRRRVADLVHIADEGITLEPVEGEPTTIRWDGVAGWERRPAGGVRLYAVDESWIELVPEGLEDAETALALVSGHLAHLPQVPSIAALNEDRLSGLADASIGDRPAARSELPALWDELDEEEEVLLLAQAGHDGDAGLLTLTEERLLWSTSEGDTPRGWLRPWTDFVRAELRTRLLGSDRVVLVPESGDELVFDGLNPAEAAGQAAEAASARIEAVRPAA